MSELKENDNALLDFAQAIKLQPASYRPYFNRALLYTDENKLDSAFADYNKSAELAPDTADVFLNRGQLLVLMDKTPDAIKDFEKATQLDANNKQAWYNLGNTYYRTQDFKKATLAFRQTVKLDGQYGKAFYGLGLAHWCYWPVFFKRQGIKFWMVFLEKFAQPTPLGKFPAGTSVDDKQRLLDALAAVHTDGAVAIPDTMTAELLEAARSGTIDYETMCQYMDAAITKVIVGQTLTTQTAPNGNRSLGDVHMSVRDDLVKADADLVCQSFNLGPVRYLIEANFAGAGMPRVFRKVDPPVDLNTEAERDNKLKTLGWVPTEERMHDVYGDGYERAPEPPPALDPLAARPGQMPPPKGKGAPAFAAAEFPDQTTLDNALDALDNGNGFASLDASLKPILDFVAEHGPQETLARFVEFYGLPVKALQERLARLLFVADIWGRIHGRD